MHGPDIQRLTAHYDEDGLSVGLYDSGERKRGDCTEASTGNIYRNVVLCLFIRICPKEADPPIMCRLEDFPSHLDVRKRADGHIVWRQWYVDQKTTTSSIQIGCSEYTERSLSSLILHCRWRYYHWRNKRIERRNALAQRAETSVRHETFQV